MKNKVKHQDIIKGLRDIASGRANDIIKLAFINPEENPHLIDGLDLTLLSEVKRTDKGAFEIKLLNRLDALKILLEELGRTESEKAEEFFGALDDAAKKRGRGSDLSFED